MSRQNFLAPFGGHNWGCFPVRLGSFLTSHKNVILGVVAIVAVKQIRTFYRHKKHREAWDSAGQDVVVLHGLPRTYSGPSLSPFVIKLETYLRMAGIKYSFDVKKPFGAKGKTPWITLNGQDMADSQLIIEFLAKKYNKDFSSSLTEEQKAIATSFRIMAEEHLLLGLGYWRWFYDVGATMKLAPGMKWYYRFVIPPLVKCGLYIQGFGRHTDQEKFVLMKKDLKAISVYLGNKLYLFGDDPCEVDCAVFSMIAQYIWFLPGSPYGPLFHEEFKNLLDYCNRMKKTFWPDWDAAKDSYGG